LAYALIAFVAAQRLFELWLGRRNAERLRAGGAREVGRNHYPLFFLVHGGWLAALVLFVDLETPLNPYYLGLYGAALVLRAWTMQALGPNWTTRVFTRTGLPLVTRGPYRILRHPNYLVVVLEIAAVPMIVGAWRIALLFSVVNAALIWWRIRVENVALAKFARQDAPGADPGADKTEGRR
jgi:methyltransferase